MVSTRSGIEGKSALEIPKDVQSAGVPESIVQTHAKEIKYHNTNS